MIADMTLALRRRLSPFRRAQFHLEGRPPRSFAEHDAVVKAIVRGDAAAAHAAMLHHVMLVEQSFEELCSTLETAWPPSEQSTWMSIPMRQLVIIPNCPPFNPLGYRSYLFYLDCRSAFDLVHCNKIGRASCRERVCQYV